MNTGNSRRNGVIVYGCAVTVNDSNTVMADDGGGIGLVGGNSTRQYERIIGKQTNTAL